MAIDEKLVEILACPKCKGAVNVNQEQTAIICLACRLSYPVIDDIPIMLIDETFDLGGGKVIYK